MARPRTVFLGSGAFAVPALRSLCESPDVDVVGVVTTPARPSGRHGALTPTPLDAAARELGLTHVLRPPRLRAPESLAQVLALEPALAVLADYGQIVPPALLDLPHGALNLHPSLLPRHRGASPIPATILAGDERTGVTLMRMDAGLDTGPIVAVAEMGVGRSETASELEARLATLAAELLSRSLGPWIRGELVPRPQPADGATLTRPLRREDGRLDPSRSAVELERAVRAYDPWPGVFVDLQSGRLIVHRAEVGEWVGEAAAGALVADGPGLALVTADGVLRLLEVQPAGGRRMSGEEARRGRPGLVGSIVVPPASS